MAVELASAYVSLLPSFKGGASALQKEAAALGNSASKSMADEIGKSSKSGGSIFRSFAGIAAAGTAIFAGAKIFKGFIDEATEAQVTSAKTAAVLKSTGGAAKVSAGDIGGLANALSLKAGVDDEIIQSGANVLLTFTKVRNEAGKGNDIFNQGTSIALDMSKALGTDLQGSVIQVGKALNDPIKGVTALQRVGVSFTEQQKDQIKTLVKSGDTLGAQKLILAELNTEFGGAAAASATSGEKLKVAWGNVQETLGGLLLPVLSKVADWFAGVLPHVAVFATKAIGTVTRVVKELASYFAAGFSDVGTNEGSGIFLFFNHLGMGARAAWGAIKTAAAGIKLAFQIVTATFAHPDLIADDAGWVGALERIARTARAVWDVISDVFPKVRHIVLTALGDVVSWIKDHWQIALAIASPLAGVVEALIFAYRKVKWFRDVVDTVWRAVVAGIQWVADNWGTIRDVIVGTLSSAWDWVQSVWVKVSDAVVGGLSAAWDWIKAVWPNVRNAVVGGLLAAWHWVQRVWPDVRDAVLGTLKAIANWVSDHWRDVGRGLMSAFDGLKTAIRWVIDHQPILIGVLSALGVGLGSLVVGFVAVQVAAVASGIAAAAAWIAAAAVPIAIGLAIAAVVAGFVWLYQNVDGFRSAVDATWKAIVAAVQWVGDNWRAIWDGIWKYTSAVVQVIVDVVTVAVNVVREVIERVIAVISLAWRTWGDELIATVQTAWGFITGIVQAAIDIVRGIIKTVVALIHGDWSGAWDGIQQVLWGVWEYIKTIVSTALETVKTTVSTAVSSLKLIWSPIIDIATYLFTKVTDPIKQAVGDVKDFLITTFASIVGGVENVWYGIIATYTWFRDHVVNPIKSAVTDVWGYLIYAFDQAVKGVGYAWDGIKAVVGTPINVVIDFYNRGIAGLWNFVDDHLGGIIGHLPSVNHVFATGGYTGPGGKYDPAGIVHKGEFVFDQDTTKNLGVDLLTFLLKTKGKGSPGRNTIDPGMFGYAAGGAVRSMEETQAWAQAQAGKPYVFPLTGPGAYDCSGFTSALVNWALGAAYPYTRRHSSGTVGNDPALKPGSGGDRGLTIGAQPPYMISRAGNFVGHTTSTIGTLNAEATPPAVRVGGAARGASALPQQYFLPNFGGPNPSEQGVIDTLRALWHLVVPSTGATPFAAMLHDLISELPHKVFDFLVTKVPQIIKDALVDVGATGAMSANPIGQAAGVIRSLFGLLGDGGRVVGPSIVGDRGVPEILWNSEGQYVESLGRRSSGGITVEGHIIGDEGFQRFVRREVEALAWRQERRAVSTRVA
jgi:phage-related protein